MMKHSSARRSSLFLMELILAVLFFSLASAVCVLLFVRSHTTGIATQELTMAVTQAQSAAEAASASAGGAEDLQKYFAGSTLSGDILTVYYDENWEMASEEHHVYEMTVKSTLLDTMQHYRIKVLGEDKSLIYELETAYHIPLTTERRLV